MSRPQLWPGAYWAVFSNLGLIFIAFMSARVALRSKSSWSRLPASTVSIIALAISDMANSSFLGRGAKSPSAIKRVAHLLDDPDHKRRR